MMIAVIANEEQKNELMVLSQPGSTLLVWLDDIKAVDGVNCYIDLLYTKERTERLQQLQPAFIIVNAITETLDTMPEGFIRINGWPGFLKGSVTEAAADNAISKTKAEEIFASFNKKIEWVPDIAGFISARVLSMIINEAWFAIEEKVSSKEEIDIAMKLGTNYPYGPFEWGEKIGLNKIYDLLVELSKTSTRYEPATLLKKEVLA